MTLEQRINDDIKAAMLAREKEKQDAQSSLTKREIILQVFKNPIVWLMALIYFGITSGSNAMNYFLPSVLESFRSTFGVEISLIQNGLLTAIPYACAAVGMIMWSRRSDKKQERHKHAAYAALMAAIAISITLIINQPWVIVFGFICLAVGVYSAINVFWTII